MRILVTNDDGIDADGLLALAEAMSHIGETVVVAPYRQQSGMAASVSLHHEMSIVAPYRQQSGMAASVSLHHEMSIDAVAFGIPDIEAYAVSGTPNDCVILALVKLANGRHFDLLVSGINYGANVGHDIHYSGTVMATLQAHFLGIPAIAVSLALRDGYEPGYDLAARTAEYLARNMVSGAVPAGLIINVNVPNIPPEKIRGIVTTRTGDGGFVRLTRLVGDENVSYAVAKRISDQQYPEGTDLWAVSADMISITPLQLDFTAHEHLPRLTDCIINLESDLLGGNGR
jgi:5'-nucleotidase